MSYIFSFGFLLNILWLKLDFFFTKMNSFVPSKDNLRNALLFFLNKNKTVLAMHSWDVESNEKHVSSAQM